MVSCKALTSVRDTTMFGNTGAVRISGINGSFPSLAPSQSLMSHPGDRGETGDECNPGGVERNPWVCTQIQTILWFQADNCTTVYFCLI